MQIICDFYYRGFFSLDKSLLMGDPKFLSQRRPIALAGNSYSGCPDFNSRFNSASKVSLPFGSSMGKKG